MQKGTRWKRLAYRKDRTSLEGVGFESKHTPNRPNGQALQMIFLKILVGVTTVTQHIQKVLTQNLGKKELGIG